MRDQGMEIIIRKAPVDDADAILAILNPIIETRAFTVLDIPFTVEAERSFIADFPKAGIFHVAIR
jgi:L-amino acid N-acyltransferase YncA